MKSPANQRCLTLFPELRDQFSERELVEADDVGAYILHEDLFMKFVATRQADELMMRRVAAYIEELATNHRDDVNLAEIGLLENAASNELHALAPYLGPASSQLMERILSHCDIDPSPWRRRRRP
jgi:hypothetical protein